MDDQATRTALQRHWDASDASDFDIEHDIYREDAVLDYPQSAERIRGRHNIRESRAVQPSKKRFAVRRMTGSGDLWVTEFTLTYDGIPSYAVSIMEFRDGQVARETQYFADPFAPAPSRAHLVDRWAERPMTNLKTVESCRRRVRRSLTRDRIALRRTRSRPCKSASRSRSRRAGPGCGASSTPGVMRRWVKSFAARRIASSVSNHLDTSELERWGLT